ncbi:sigma-70 family RNA polymerase sigma factor [Pseudomonas sp. UL073]|uniref:Sigma-70 family RNA polymerase sigma factor n=1 Tax=Zestomonas insulae TaxID=2809017 RepID=A0ABS2ICK0_9GAMM|nr:sigma-70 family RNA polymerase sigma factor [Pseudomonas insulae]MBM7060029.1 sigma-70 family RNA polymerase sigma factor [Pseudomonas insulae]
MPPIPPPCPPSLDAASVGELYVEHNGWLTGWLRKRLGCSQNAADVAQDTFVRILATREQLGLREPKAFLATVARRLLIDRARRRAIEQAYLDELQYLAESLDGFPSAEQVAAAVEALEQIAEALQGLASKARQAFLWRQLDGLSHAEIAARLGVSTKMVQKYLVQALLHCHRRLEDPA